jgi:sn-glycerol 3-phosphate transport system substrate-binding protein
VGQRRRLTAAGLDPDTVSLETWDEVRAVAKQVVDAGAAPCGFSFAWPTWTQFEQFSAIHDVPSPPRERLRGPRRRAA